MLKRFFAVFFLILFLLYHVGYLAFYWHELKKSEEQWLVTVEVTSDMKHITLPITLPYWTDQFDYRPAHGTIWLDGQPYRTVLQKYAGDAIHLIVAKDTDRIALDRSMSDWLQMLNDTETQNSGKGQLYKAIAKDYIGHRDIQVPLSQISNTDRVVTGYFFILKEHISEINTPPPQV